MANAEKWDKSNNPFNLVPKLQRLFSTLEMTGELEDARKGWPASHWSNYLGGIAHRWSAADPKNFSYKPYTLDELKTLQPYQINELSPIEKFEIFKRNYKYPLTTQILKMNSPDDLKWHGICHGVAPATMNHAEPQTVSLTNADGITVKFYSSDVGALMSHYYANVSTAQSALIGRRCRQDSDTIPETGPCSDLNAGAFHLVVTNRLGKTGPGFIADIDRRSEVWNHVAVKYISYHKGELAPGPRSALGTVKRIRLETIVTYAAAISPKFFPVIGTPDAYYAAKTYEYYVELDKDGKVIGGEWLSLERPDFVWIQSKTIFRGAWAAINEVYIPVQ